MIRYYPLALSETFIKDQSKKIGLNVMMYHSPFPINYYISRSKFYIFCHGLLSIIVKAFTRYNNRLYTFLVLQLLKKHRSDVVFIQFGSTAARMYRACIKLNIPFVIHFHGSDAHCKSTINKYLKQYREMLRAAKAIIVVSEKMKNVLIGLGADPLRIFINPYGVDADFFKQKIGSEYFLSVGRFVEKKAPNLTIEAFSKVLKKYPEHKLLMIGSGPLLKKCIDLTVKLRIEDKVHFLGAKNRDEVRKYMSNAFVFLQHSVTAPDGDSEGSPVAITEAAMSGIPVVSTFHTGIPAIVKDGETGLLVEEGDTMGMAAAMIRLIEEPLLYKNMSNKAREHAIQYYNQDYRLEELRKIILKVGKNNGLQGF